MDLQKIAGDLQVALAANRREAISDNNALDVQALCFAEEAGELVGAYRRYAGKARRSGTLGEVEGELADVLITASILAVLLGIDIEGAVDNKLKVIYSRGWKQDA